MPRLTDTSAGVGGLAFTGSWIVAEIARRTQEAGTVGNCGPAKALQGGHAQTDRGGLVGRVDQLADVGQGVVEEQVFDAWGSLNTHHRDDLSGFFLVVVEADLAEGRDEQI